LHVYAWPLEGALIGGDGVHVDVLKVGCIAFLCSTYPDDAPAEENRHMYVCLNVGQMKTARVKDAKVFRCLRSYLVVI
jgi:hypothetical protein